MAMGKSKTNSHNARSSLIYKGGNGSPLGKILRSDGQISLLLLYGILVP